MKINAVYFAAGVALLGFGAASAARAQFMSNYPIIIVPPPAQDYAKPAPKSPQPAKPKPSDTPTQTAPLGGHYEGRTFVPD